MPDSQLEAVKTPVVCESLLHSSSWCVEARRWTGLELLSQVLCFHTVTSVTFCVKNRARRAGRGSLTVWKLLFPFLRPIRLSPVGLSTLRLKPKCCLDYFYILLNQHKDNVYIQRFSPRVSGNSSMADGSDPFIHLHSLFYPVMQIELSRLWHFCNITAKKSVSMNLNSSRAARLSFVKLSVKRQDHSALWYLHFAFNHYRCVWAQVSCSDVFTDKIQFSELQKDVSPHWTLPSASGLW